MVDYCALSVLLKSSFTQSTCEVCSDAQLQDATVFIYFSYNRNILIVRDVGYLL